MSLSAAVVRELVAAGLSGEALVQACERIQADACVDPVAEKRRAYDRERKRQQKANSTGIPPESTGTKEKTPRTPQKKNIPPSPPKGGSSPTAQDLSEAYEAYQTTANSAGFPVSRQFSPDRQQKLRRALDEFGLSGWLEALEIAAKSPFCRGENDRGWRVDLDFLLQPTSLRRLLEGRYSGQPKPRANSPPRGETVAESAIRDLEKLRNEQPSRQTDRPALPSNDGRYPGGISGHVVAAIAAKR